MDKNFDYPEKFNVSGEIYNFIKDGFKSDTSEFNFQHFNADLDVTIKSPIVLFPIDILDNSNKKCILIRCGDFQIFSMLPPRQDPKVNYAEVKERHKLIDKYFLRAQQLCVTTLDNFDGDMSRLLDCKGLNLIEDVSLVVNADIMFEPKNTFFERFKIEISVGKCKVNVRDIQLPFFMEMFEKSGKLIQLATYKLEKKTYFEKKEIKINKEEEETYNKNNKNKIQKKNEKIELNDEKIELNDKKIELNDKKIELNDKKIELNDKKIELNNEKIELNDEKIELINEKIEINNEKNNEKIELNNEKNELNNEKIELNDEKNELNNDKIEIIDNNKENIKEQKDTKDNNLLIFNFHLDSLQLCLQKTISFGESLILSRSKEEKFKNLIYRDFIIFDMNTFKIELLLTEKLNANALLLIKSIGVIDKETLITNENNPYGDLYINKDFQHIIKMDSGEDKNEMDSNSSLQRYRISSDYYTEESFVMPSMNDYLEENIISNKNNDINKDKDNYDTFFMVLKFNHDNETQTQYADILLKKIKVCISMSTMGRISQFVLYYSEMFYKIIEKNLAIWENMEKEHKKEKMKNKLIRKLSNNSIEEELTSESDSDEEDEGEINSNNNTNEDLENSDDNKIIDNKLISEIAKDKNKEKEKENEEELIIDTSSKKDNCNDNEINIINSQNNIIINNNNDIDKNDIDKNAEETLKNKEIKLSKIFRTKNKKINIKIKFDLRETSLLFPLDDTKSVTKVIRFKSNINGNIHLKTNFDLIRDGNTKLVKIDFKENMFNTGVKILNVELGILNYQNGIYYIDNLYDKILSGFRLCLNINSFLLLPKKEQNVTLVNIDLEPIVFNISFTHIKALIKFIPIIMEFVGEMKRGYDDPITEIEDIDVDEDINNNNNIINDNNKDNDLNIISTSTKNNDNENEGENENKINEINNNEKYKKRKRNKKKKKNKKKKNKNKKENDDDQPEINIMKLNNTFDVTINLEKALIKIMDDSGYYIQPLLNIEFREPPIKCIINTNSDSVDNISNFLIESISHKEISLNEYDIKNLALYAEIAFSFSITFYNNRIEDWEPIIEKYEASITLDQIAWFSRLRVLYNSNDMLNLNISFALLCTVNDILKKILCRGDKGPNLLDVAKNTDDKIAIEFINLSGIDINCWLDAEDSIMTNEDINLYKRHKFNLDSNINNRKHKKKIKRNRLNKIYKKLTEAQLRIKKDKFSFKVQGFLPIISNDFSSNYTTCFKLQKDKNDKYVDKRLYFELENNKSNGMKENSDDNEIRTDNDNIEEKNLLLKEKLLPKNNEEEDNIIDTSMKKKDLMVVNEENEEENIEIYVKIRKNGNLKSIVFESNIFFYNNLQIPISLSLISQKDFINRYNSNDNLINHEKNYDKLVIDSGTKKSLSLNYLIKKYRVYISFHDISNKEKYNYSLLYENFNELNNNYNNFIKYEQENLPTYKGRKETELNDYYSKMVIINCNEKNFYICSNLIIQHGTNDIIKEIPNQTNIPKKTNVINDNEIIENDNVNRLSLLYDLSHKKAFSYLFILNESLVIENQLPFNIQCEIEGDIKKQISIRPLQNKYFLEVNQYNTKMRLVLKYQNKIFISNFFDIMTLGQKLEENMNNNENKNKNKEDIETTIKLYEGKDLSILNDKYIECNIKIEKNIENDKFIGAYEKEFDHNVKSFPKKRKIIIYNKCIIINKFDSLLYIKSENTRERDFNAENYNGKIFPNSVNILNTNDTDIKKAFKIKCDNSNWSDKFNINTIGHIGVISLEKRMDNNIIKNIEISVSINSSWNFSNSLLITIEPRFFLINKFGYDLEYKQYNNKKDKRSNDQDEQFRSHVIKNGEEIKLNLLKGSKKMKKMIQIKIGQHSIDYSCPIDLDEIGDVDIKIPIDEEMKQKILKNNIEIEKK